MGYTHYWRGWVTLSDSFITDVQAIIEQSGVTIAGWDGEGEPTLTNEEIRLNGSVVGDNDHETFLLINGVNRSTSFCKTAHKPYDIVVAAILLRAANLNKGFKVESDGNWENDDWTAARDLYFMVFREQANRPETLRLASMTS